VNGKTGKAMGKVRRESKAGKIRHEGTVRNGCGTG
jgi:hypothetical protein